MIVWNGPVIRGIAVSTSSWKQAVSSSMVFPAGDPDNGPASGARVWTLIPSAVGWVKRLSGCWKRRTIGRSPGKRQDVAAQSPRVRCVLLGGPLMRSPAGVAVALQPRFRRQLPPRLWLRSSLPIRGSGRRTTASGCSAGRAQPSRQLVSSLTLLQIRLAPAGPCRAPAVAGPINGRRGMGVG